MYKYVRSLLKNSIVKLPFDEIGPGATEIFWNDLQSQNGPQAGRITRSTENRPLHERYARFEKWFGARHAHVAPIAYKAFSPLIALY